MKNTLFTLIVAFFVTATGALISLKSSMRLLNSVQSASASALPGYVKGGRKEAFYRDADLGWYSDA